MQISIATGLGPLLLRKRRSKARKAPAPPIRTPVNPEQARLLDEAESAEQTSTPSTSTAGKKAKYIEFFD